MKNFKTLFFVIVASIIFTSCKSISKIPVPKGSETVVNIPAKKGTLSDDEMNKWSHADLETDSIPGMSIEKAYQFIATKKGVEVIVGVVDAGIDLKHEDLKNVSWINKKEIANNGIDEDKNGYIDDINGWNFLGSIYKENLEYERIVKNPSIASEEEAKAAKAFYDKKIEDAENSKKRFEQILEGVTNADATISENLKKTTYTKEEVLGIVTESLPLLQSIAVAEQMYNLGLPSLNIAKKELTKLVVNATDLLKSTVLKKEYRSAVGDNPNTMDKKFYGNNKTGHSTKDEAHGTHVSGIIAASRNNELGMDGVANNVKIMAIRAVPDGDEYDKDIALGIRYAVNNGAKIINTSFGKDYSPKKEWVYEAIKYAASKDVLIVNAAGNAGKNIDIEKTYPNDSKDLINEISDNMLTVGAVSVNYNENLPASFSNYGKKNVDVFAPGVQIYATTPENEYKKFSGTSMAAPSTVGVAALIRSYYPKLSASQVKHILMNSGIKINFEVIKPGTQSKEKPDGEKVPFADLSVSGRVINAYNALKMADRIVNRKTLN